MPDLLLELFSEEIPARMQAKAADDLRRMVTDKLVAEGLIYEGAKAFATPRRLALTVHGIPARQPDLKEERRGPRIGGPDAAIQGFLKATGLASLSEAKVQPDKKGDFYIALIEKKGRATLEVLAEILPVIVRTFPWPKSMRWGARSARPGSLNWVRPLHAMTATFGLETEEPDVVKFAIDGIETGQTTFGHRFMAPAAINVRRFEDYEAKLLDARVVLDPERRKDTILTDAKQLAFAQGFELVEDQGLLDEVAGLVEWPVVLMGSFEQEYLVDPRRGHPRHHPQQPEMLCRQRSRNEEADQQVHHHGQYRGGRWRQDHHRRQRTRHPRAIVGREVLLRGRSEDQARGSAAEIRADRVPREAGHARTAHQAHRAAGRGDRANHLEAARDLFRRQVPECRRFQGRAAIYPPCVAARRSLRRRTFSPKWSANSRSCRA